MIIYRWIFGADYADFTDIFYSKSLDSIDYINNNISVKSA